MNETIHTDRRQFLKMSAGIGGGMLLGIRMGHGATPLSHSKDDDAFKPNAWLRIDTDDTITFIIDRTEMGQGVMTSLSMLIAEELEVGLDQIQTRFAPAAPEYANRIIGSQITGGSTSVRGAWQPLRKAGATAREMLIQAAAKTWEVDKSECKAANGAIIHKPTGKKSTYGALSNTAAGLPVPKNVPLKSKDQFRLIGKPTLCLDAEDKIHGRTVFGVDMDVPGTLVATLVRCPVFGGKAKRVNTDKAKAVKGVHDVIEIKAGVAVIAEHFWAAKQGRKQLDIEWDTAGVEKLDQQTIYERFKHATRQSGEISKQQGDAKAALTKAATKLEADYQTPYVAHAPMEPMNCTAWVQKERCDIWVPTQAQTRTLETAKEITGLSTKAIHVHTTFAGGGFGRRLEQDFVAPAVQLAHIVKKPVKLMYTFEDEIQHDFYRPANWTRLQAALDDQGKPIAWLQHIAGPENALGGLDIPYKIPNLQVETTEEDPGIPTGPWRSVGASQNAFVIESFIDEMAHAAKQDPLDYRLALLSDAPRHKNLLTMVAEKSQWKTTPAKNHYRGVALYHSFASWVAQVAEVSVTDEGGIHVHKVTCAIDCGTTVNPDTIAAQMEGAVAMALTAAIKSEITIEAGRVKQSNFHDFPLIKLAEMPEVEVHIMPSDEPPGGVGEPGIPPLAPAVANAVYAATGQRLRKLPLSVTIKAMA